MIDKNDGNGIALRNVVPERSLADRIQHDSSDRLTNFMLDKGFSRED